MIAMLDILKELTNLKEGLGIPLDFTESFVQLPSETLEESKTLETIPE